MARQNIDINPRQYSTDPLSKNNILGTPEPGLVDLLAGILRAAPGGWGDVSNLVDMGVNNYNMQRSRHLADVAQQSLNLDPASSGEPTMTDAPGLLSRLGIGGPPQPRPLTPEERFGYNQGQVGRLELMQKMANLRVSDAKARDLQNKIDNAPENQKLKILMDALAVGREYGPEAGAQVSGDQGVPYPNVPPGGKGEAQTRGQRATKEPKLSAAAQTQARLYETLVKKFINNGYKPGTSALSGSFNDADLAAIEQLHGYLSGEYGKIGTEPPPMYQPIQDLLDKRSQPAESTGGLPSKILKGAQENPVPLYGIGKKLYEGGRAALSGPAANEPGYKPAGQPVPTKPPQPGEVLWRDPQGNVYAASPDKKAPKGWTRVK